MIAKLAPEDFPLTEIQIEDALQVVAKHIHARYRSPFTLVLVLPQSLYLGKKLETALTNDKALPLTVAIGMMPTVQEGKPVFVVIEPPSVHSIKGRKCIVFDAQDDWLTARKAAEFIRSMHPSSIEIASFISRGTLPKWVNPDYVAFETAEDVVVKGLGLGYTEDAANGAALVAERVVLNDAKVVAPADPVETTETQSN